MAQVSHLKSPAITNLDATPVVFSTTGEGAPGYVRSVEGFVTAVAADEVLSTYQLVRVPSNSKVKAVDFYSEAQGAGAVELGVYYSDSTVDGTTSANQGLVVLADFFMGETSIASAVGPTNEVFAHASNSGSNNVSLWNTPLWSALGLSADPGGYFDIVATVNTTAITTGGGRIGARVSYVD